MSKPLLLGADGKTEALVGTSNAQIPSWSAAAQEWIAIPNNAAGAAAGTFFFNFGNQTGVTPYSGLPLTTPGPSDPNTTPSLLGPTFNPLATKVTSANLTNGTYTLIAGFVTPQLSPNATSIPKGLWDFNIWAKSTNAANGTQVSMQARVYLVKGDGTGYGSASGSSDTFPIGGTSPTTGAVSDEVFLYEQATIAQYILNVTFANDVAISATDRLYIEFYARKAVTQNRTIEFYFATNQPSHVHTTLPNLVDLGTGVTGILPLANGGTNKVLTASNGQVVYSDADSLELTTGGSAGQYLGYGTPPTWSTPTLTQAYDLRGKFVGNPASSIILDSFAADRSFTIGATNTLHKFYCTTPPPVGQSVQLTIKKTPIAGGGAVTVFTATFFDSTTNPQSNNGLYPATIGSVSNNTVAVGDLITVEMGTTQAAFTTPIWTIYGTA
jgi:hypothetical protein